MRVVLDSNVVLAAFATRGLCYSLFELCLLDHRIVISQRLLEEVKKDLSKIKVPTARTQEVVQLLRENSHLASPKKLPRGVCRDPKDAHVLGLAVAAGADYIITGDQDLLTLGKFQSIPVTPRQFWDALTKKKK